MQVQRKSSIEFTLVWVSFFLIGMDLYNRGASVQPGSSQDSNGYDNIALRFANTAFFWLFASFCQWAW
eukprot:13901239-Ditylum_brightwellii.AAC.1